jgi:ABC-2 type transport system permease protein
MLKEIKIYFKLTKMHLLSQLEYKGFWMMFIYVTISLIADFLLSTVLLFLRFGGVGEWKMEQILLVYMFAATSYGLAKIIFVGFEDFPWKMIQSGDFDRFLMRPCSLFTQITGACFRPHRIPWALNGIIIIIWLLFKLNIPFNFFNIFVLILSLLGGLLTYIGVFVLTSGIAFFTIKGLDWIYIFTSASRQVTRCPVEYMPNLLKNTFTFIMPILVISYYPAALICGWGEPKFTSFLALPVEIAFFCFSLLIWKIGVRHYKSTGS